MDNAPHWAKMESYGLNLSLPSYIYSDTVQKLCKPTKNPIVKHMMKIWYEVMKYLNEPQSLSQFTPLWGNQFFVPGRADATFKWWLTKGLGTIQDLYTTNSGDMTSFDGLRAKYHLNRKHFSSTVSLEIMLKQTKTMYFLNPVTQN